ncbi:MAG: FAD-dependent oxidoreductase [Pseudomonadota bacterium]
MSDRIVIVGAGHAAGQLVASLKQKKHAGEIVVIGEEPYLPYQRPPLSKKFLAGELPAERLIFKPESFYDDDNIEIRLSTRITSIDRRGKVLLSEAGEAIHYDKLVLAIGSRVRTIPIDGTDLSGVHYLRTIDDVTRIRSDVEASRRAVIVGGGYIGLEVAAVLRTAGLKVTVVEMADRVMSRVVSPEISDFYQIEHASHGVNLRLSTGVTAIRGDDRVSSVATDAGEAIKADVVIIGAGIVPNVELGREAGLDTDDGIVVDAHCRTSDPHIYAVGDCTSHPSETYGRSLRLESVPNALEQAKTAAANLCGEAATYTEVPWFWSDQYDLKLQIAGLSQGYDDVVIRGNPTDRSFACLYLKDGVVIAADAVNAPRDFMQSKALIAGKACIDKESLADTDRQLKELAS